MTQPARRPRAVPDDKPFDFNLDAIESEVDLTPFRVHFGGKRWEFAHLDGLNEWPLVEAADAGEAAAMREIFKQSLGGQWADFRKLPLPRHKARELWKEFQKHCGYEQGESDGSTDS